MSVSSPTNVSYNVTTKILSWQSTYSSFIITETTSNQSITTNNNFYDFTQAAAQFMSFNLYNIVIVIKAVNAGIQSNASVPLSINLLGIPAPTDISYNKNTNILNWNIDPIYSSSYFRILDTITGRSFITRDTSYNIMNLIESVFYNNINFVIGVCVSETNGVFKGTLSMPLSIYIGGISAPTNIHYNSTNKTITWDSSYSFFRLTLISGNTSYFSNTTSYVTQDTDINKTFVIRAIDSGYISDPSNPITINLSAISNICFIKETPVLTDQGIIEIQNITNKNTINNIKVKYITETTSKEDYLVCIEKDFLGENIPNKKIILTGNHKIMYNEEMIKSEDIPNVNKIKYNGELLYNVLLEENSFMKVNNLICETLDINNVIAKIYDNPNKNDIITKLNQINDWDIYKKTAIELLS